MASNCNIAGGFMNGDMECLMYLQGWRKVQFISVSSKYSNNFKSTKLFLVGFVGRAGGWDIMAQQAYFSLHLQYGTGRGCCSACST